MTRMSTVICGNLYQSRSKVDSVDGKHNADPFCLLVQPVPTGQWIAIIERGQCRFSEKIRNAIDANASAVIIYDNEPDKMPLFMHHDG